MKKRSMFLIILGVIMIIVGFATFNNLTTVNAVDSHRWTINLNGLESFQWPGFTGGVFIVIGVIFHIADFGNTKVKID